MKVNTSSQSARLPPPSHTSQTPRSYTGAAAYKLPSINGRNAVGRRSLPSYTMASRLHGGAFSVDHKKVC